jgi:glycosyltransferase involved in cell wall biosynthesis
MQEERNAAGPAGNALEGTGQKPLRVAIVHFWFTRLQGGAERVVDELLALFPQAEIFALVAEPASLSPEVRRHTMHTSFLDRLPGARRFHRHFLPLMPLALEQFDLSGFDLVISSESGPAKGVITPPSCCHICYCHSPMRYLWDMYPGYVRTMPPVVRQIFALTAHFLRLWDLASASRVDHFIANSHFVAARVRKFYRRESTVIHPPVLVDAALENAAGRHGDYYLTAGRLIGYKRNDLAIEACNRLGRTLYVVGDGPELPRLRKLAGPSIRFLGKIGDTQLRQRMKECRALLFPGEEDFGIVPVEAQGFGRPVIAYASGGALETVRGGYAGEVIQQGSTGLFFREQSADSLAGAIEWFEQNESVFEPQKIHAHALRFSAERFRRELQAFVREALRRHAAENAFASADEEPCLPVEISEN